MSFVSIKHGSTEFARLSSNGSVTLNCADTYVEDNITVELAGSSGGVDVSDTTAIASDVLSGKIFYAADGTRTTGTGANIIASNIEPTSAEGNDGDVWVLI